MHETCQVRASVPAGWYFETNTMETCKDCGRPLARVDDFWYCDNPQCPGRRGSRGRDEKDDQAGAAPKKPRTGRPATGSRKG
jgi:hypothetical protein